MNNFFKRRLIDRLSTSWMQISLFIVLLLPMVIAVGLAVKSSNLLSTGSLGEILFSSEWQPLSGKFGFKPFIVSSFYVTLISLVIAIPVCMLSAIYLTHYASKKTLNLMHTVIDILAGIPSVIFGVWGILIIVPFIGNYLAPFFGINSSGYSILTAGIVLAVMIIPFVLNMLIEILKNIPTDLKESSLSIGATNWQTIKYVVLKKALPGITAVFSLGISRAFGETIAVLMVVGNVVKVPKSLFDPGYPLPALIANNYGEMLSIPIYDSALMFAALLLLVIVIVFNSISRAVIARFEY
jgi:phosphate transport system permease protein